MSRRGRSFLLALGLAPPFYWAACCDADDGQATLNRIRKSWEARQDSFHSGRMVWTQVDSYDASVLPHTGAGRGPRNENPAIDDVTTTRAFTFDGRQSRYAWSGDKWNELRGRFEEQTCALTFDGREMRYCREYLGFPSETRAHGMLGSEAVRPEPAANDWNVEVPVMTFRPLVPEFCPVSLGDFVVRADLASPERAGLICLRAQHQGIEQFLWLDPTRDYAIARHEWVVKGRPYTQMDIEYGAAADAIPRGWRHVRFRHPDRFTNADGSVFHETVATVTSTEVNVAIGPQEFTIVFPPGAQINADGAITVVRKDGTLRKIARHELRQGLTMDQLAETPSLEEIARRRQLVQWIGIGTGLVLALAVGIIWRRGFGH